MAKYSIKELKMRKFFVLTWVCLFGVLGAGTGWSGQPANIGAPFATKPANVIVVAKSGGDFTSISAAMAAINPAVDNPYVVKVMPGVYYEYVQMKSYVHLQGSGRDVTTIMYDMSPWYIVKCESIVNAEISGLTLDGYGIYNNNASPTISGNLFKASSSNTGGGGGVINYYSSPLIRNNVFDFSNLPGSDSAYGISNGHSSPTISDNIIIGNGGNNNTGISISWPSKPIITGNVIKGEQVGISYAGGGGPVCGEEGGLIANNYIEGNQTGISTFATSPIIKNNTIKNNTSDGISYGSYGGHACGDSVSASTIEGNTITGNGRYGITGQGGPTIIHNKITNNVTADLNTTTWGITNISFNVFNTNVGSGAVGNYNLKPDGTPAPLQ